MQLVIYLLIWLGVAVLVGVVVGGMVRRDRSRDPATLYRRNRRLEERLARQRWRSAAGDQPPHAPNPKKKAKL
jgi:uncharacterized protein YgiB involved in biofilm formation